MQDNVITRNPRIGVSHEGTRTWNLHIRDVQRADQGRYMCQINTAKAKTRLGYLNVVGEYNQGTQRLTEFHGSPWGYVLYFSVVSVNN